METPKSIREVFLTRERDQARAAAVALRTLVANALSEYEEDEDVEKLINTLKETQ